MKTYCTLSDINYLNQGKALFRSLAKVSSEDFVLYYLCLDQDTYDYLIGYDARIVPVFLSEVEKTSEKARQYKNNSQYNEYCWSLASTFSLFLLEKHEIDSVMYMDSDLYFYQDPKLIYDEIGEKSVGIIRHRHNTSLSPDGEYNVGIIYFKNDEDGLNCLRWWNDAILLKTNPELATCGDQKYLEGFIPRFGDSVCVVDETIAHGAPWNYRLYVYDYIEDGNVIWGDKIQPLVFNHFSKFGYTDQGQIWPDKNCYTPHTMNGAVYLLPAVHKFYVDYHTALGEA